MFDKISYFFHENKAVLIIFFTIANIILSAYWLFQGEIHYDIDISRDFLVISEAVSLKKPFLIGPHSGIIAGVFHGPLWYYLNIPVFILSHGNPVSIGWFWWGLSVFTVYIIYLVAKKMFGKSAALISILLYSANSIINPMDNLKQFFNPYGAVVLSSVFYYFFVMYLKSRKVKYLILTLLINGFLIQFQMAFGGPILVVSSLFIFWFIYKNKLWKHILSYIILLLPLSTFIAFDLRHGFLQLRSLYSYIFLEKHGSVPFFQFLIVRTQSVFIDVYNMLLPDSVVTSWLLSFFILFVFYNYKLFKKIEYQLFLFLYFGYWIFLYVFKGWTGNYYWPFLPIVIILISSFGKILPKRVFKILIFILVVWNLLVAFVKISEFPKEVTRRGINSWTYNKLIAEIIYKDAGQDFGYFIFTPDRWVYNQMYALSFMQNKYSNIHSFPSEKKALTYLLIVDPPKGRSDIDPVGWRITDLGIKRESTDFKRLDVITIYKYYLTDTEINTPVNPYLMNDTFFR